MARVMACFMASSEIGRAARRDCGVQADVGRGCYGESLKAGEALAGGAGLREARGQISGA